MLISLGFALIQERQKNVLVYPTRNHARQFIPALKRNPVFDGRDRCRPTEQVRVELSVPRREMELRSSRQLVLTPHQLVCTSQISGPILPYVSQ